MPAAAQMPVISAKKSMRKRARGISGQRLGMKTSSLLLRPLLPQPCVVRDRPDRLY